MLPNAALLLALKGDRLTAYSLTAYSLTALPSEWGSRFRGENRMLLIIMDLGSRFSGEFRPHHRK